MSNPRVSVIICTCNRASSLSAVLGDIAAQAGLTALECEVLVVDNGSTDETPAVVEQWRAEFPVPLRYLQEPERGKSRALNLGIREASGQVFVFTDDDVRIPIGWLRALVAPFRDPSLMGVGGAVRPHWVTPPPEWVSDSDPYRMMAAIVQYWHGPVPGPTTTPPVGANCAWRRTVFERHDGFRVDLGPSGARSALGEDTEFGLRMQAAGEPVWYAPDALVYHPVAPERLNKQYFLDWYYNSGRVEAFRPTPELRFRIAGVPRHLFRELAEVLLRWGLSRRPERRFFYKLRVYQTVGRIRGYRERHLGRPLPA